MKTLNLLLPTFILLLFCSSASFAQEQIAIPLSKPGEPGKLKLGIVRGSISVTGYDGQEVIVRYAGEESNRQQSVTKNGLRRISSNGVGFEAEEYQNEVEISGASPMREISFEVSVPRNFSLELSTVNGGDIRVENVNGEMEISNVNGEITLTNVSGSAVANTVNGKIQASFNSIDTNKPMAFSNLNGDIDVTLPADAQITVKMKSEWGEIFTDFEMDINRQDRGSVNAESDSETYRVSVNNWIYGSINGGGPEYLFKSMRGDIYIRSK